MSSWLDPVRRVLDEAAEPRLVFFRDDDAGWDHPALARLLEAFTHHRVPIDLAVIPDAVDDELVDLLEPVLDPGAVRIHQHGWRHRNHEAEGRRYELGPSRSRAHQEQDLRAGARRLAAAFGARVDPVFTPPWNRCTPTTGDLLVQLGWRVLSRDHTAVPLEVPGLAEVAVTFDWSGRTRSQAQQLAEGGRRLALALARPGPSGIMLHHAVTSCGDLAAIGQLLGLVAGHPLVQLTSIMAVAGLDQPAHPGPVAAGPAAAGTPGGGPR